MIKKIDGIEYEVIKAEHKSEINLLFVHGTACNKTFLRSLAVLFKEFNCYLIDLPGHGGSRNSGYNVENYVRAVSCIAERLKNVVLIGHSLGGTIVAKTASLNLKSVIGAVILNSAARYPKLDRALVDAAYNGVVNFDYLLEACGHQENEDVKKAMAGMEPAGVGIADLLIDDGVNVESSMKNIKIPVLIIGGEDEILIIPEYVERLHKLIKTSELIMMPGGRHMVCVAEKYKAKELICEFINKKVLRKKEKVLV